MEIPEYIDTFEALKDYLESREYLDALFEEMYNRLNDRCK